jgi:sporulation protein YlmC with PRC-barrel domain
MVKLSILAPAVGLLAAVSLGDALAQQRPMPPTTPAHQGATWKGPHGLVDSRELVGTRVKGAEGKDLGAIDALVIDPRDGKVSHVVVGMGGLIGVGERKVVMPWSQVKLGRAAGGKRMTATVDAETLLNAPRYERQAERDRTVPSASPAMPPGGPR